MNYRETIKKPVVRRLAVSLLIFFIVVTIGGFFILPPVIKSALTKKLSESLKREVSLSEVKVNPFALSVRLGNLVISERNKPGKFISVGDIYIK
ncbi:MAG: hypothetical protein HZB33_11700 [Nitrospirae bacterium]|nr:hypothetical protein [Nitrospirota bacterium]